MKSFVRFAAVLASVLALSAFAKETTATMKVSGWMCDGCPTKTENALKDVPGVKSVKVDKAKSTAIVTYDDSKAKPVDLEKAVASSGFAVEK